MINVEIRENFQDKHDEVASTKDQKLLISHCGIFTTELIRELAATLVRISVSHGASSIMQKRLFSIAIEGLKNLKMYAEPDEKGAKVGFLIISRVEDEYRVQIANVVTKENYELIKKYLHQINNTSDTELEKTFHEILRNELLGLKGKKGRGFINARIKSGNIIEHTFNTLENDLLLLSCYLKIKLLPAI